jgi:hypothetical protein
MTTATHGRLHPGALAIAGGIAGLVAALFVGFGMLGFGSMMGGGGGGWMMGGGGWTPGAGGWMPGAGYGHMGFGGGLTMLIAFVVVGLVAGWAAASVYNAVIGRSEITTAINQTPVPRHE